MKTKEKKDPPPPDHLRCRRNAGLRKWRCKNLSADNPKQFCEQHYLYSLNQNKRNPMLIEEDGGGGGVLGRRRKKKLVDPPPPPPLDSGGGGGRLEWRIKQENEDFLCEEETGVMPLAVGYGSRDGRADSQSKRIKADTQNRCLECVVIRDKYRNGLKEWISCLDDQKVMSEREKRAQETIMNCRIRKAEDEVEIWKKKFCELESRIMRIQEENSTLRELGPGGLQLEASHNEEGQIREKDTIEMSKLQAKTNVETNSSHMAQLQAKEKVLDANKKIRASAFAGYELREGRADFQIYRRQVNTRKRRSKAQIKRCSLKSGDSVESKKYLVELENDLEVYKTKCLEVSAELEKKKMECIAIQDKYGDVLKECTSYLEDKKVIGVREKWARERITYLRITSLKEDKKVICEREKRAQEKVRYLEDELRKTSTDEREKYIQLITYYRLLECAKQRAEDEVEVWKKRFCELEARVVSMEEENSTLRCMESRVCGRREFGRGGSQNEAPQNVEGGNIEIGDSDHSLKRSSETEKDLTSNKCLKRPCLDQRDEENWSSCKDFTFTLIHKQKRTSEILNSESEDEDAVKMTKCPGLEHEILKPSPMNLFSETRYVSSRGQDVELRKKELKWKFEADMLSSLEENPELCMKAICALYRQQSSEENSMKGLSHYNSRGFNKFDALRGSNLAEFLMDGDRRGDLKKSVKELEMFDPKALQDCKRLALLYSEQLFTIYRNEEDPFFLPSSSGC